MPAESELWADVVAEAHERLRSAICRRMLEATSLDRIEFTKDGTVVAELSVDGTLARPDAMARVRAAIEASLSACSTRRAKVTIAVKTPQRAAARRSSRTPARRRSRTSGRIDRAAPAALRATVDLPARASQSADEIERATLNDGLRLEAFVCGTVNKVVHRLAQDVAARTGSSYANPLLMYGSSGTGKTHLLQGIALFVRDAYPDLNVAYATAESFSHRFAESIRSRRVQKFRNRLRNLDYLVIDDIQGFARRNKVQEELLHTLDALTARKRQVVLGCDVPPRKLASFHPGLRDRFASGIVVEVGVPDHQTRLGITAALLRSRSVFVSDQVQELVARRCRSGDVRELIGAVNNIAAVAQLCKVPIDETMARRILRENVRMTSDDGRPTLEEIANRVSRALDLEVDELRGSSRREPVCAARRIAMTLARKYVDATLRTIGDFFGHKSGASVSAAERAVERMVAKGGAAADAFGRLDAELRDDYGPLETTRTRRNTRTRA